MLRALMLTTLLAGPALALDEPRVALDDPYKSGMWNYQQVHILGDPDRVTFDDRVVVRAPHSAEDPFEVPVLIDATGLDQTVEKIVISVDYGPIPKILTFYPGRAEPKLSFRFKIDQATPVRASVQTADGAWHVGGTYIDAAGGGCTAPAQAYAADDWEERLGEVRARSWPGVGRLRLMVDHPMDTGLADGIPIFIIENIDVRGADGEPIARLELHEPVDEDPTFTLHMAPALLDQPLRIQGRDNNGNEIDATLPRPLTQ